MIMFSVDKSVAVIYSNGLFYSETVGRPSTITFAHYHGLLSRGEGLPSDKPIYDFLEAYNSVIFRS